MFIEDKPWTVKFEVEIYAPNEKSAKRKAMQIAEFIFLEEEVNKVAGGTPVAGELEFVDP